jgi:UDP-MurNAc hydroxylase
MKVTLLGHAAVLVEMADAVCLMDPVLFDPFEEGAVTSCPKRSVFADRLPRVDTLIVSHRHPDHFDLRSSALVPRDADVIVPGDPLIAYALNALGFRHIHPVAPMAPILSERFELFPTRSDITAVREFGMVFKDPSGTFWNQADSELSPATIDAVRQRFARPDLLFAMYASQNFDYFDRRSIEFPYETHRQNLANVFRIDPHNVAPGAAGFRFCGAHAWLNPFLFPISRRRFAEDLERLGFQGAIAIMNPGDVFDIESGRVVHGPGASTIAVMDEDDSAAIEFDPTAPVPALSDPNPDGRSKNSLQRIICPFIDGFAGYARAGDAGADKVVGLYRRHGVAYTLAIVFPNGEIKRHRFDFGPDAVHITSGTTAPGNVGHSIAASALVAWIEHTKSLFYVRVHSRRYQAVYDVATTPDGPRLRHHMVPDLLMHYVLNVAPDSDHAARLFIDRQLASLQHV